MQSAECRVQSAQCPTSGMQGQNAKGSGRARTQPAHSALCTLHSAFGPQAAIDMLGSPTYVETGLHAVPICLRLPSHAAESQIFVPGVTSLGSTTVALVRPAAPCSE